MTSAFTETGTWFIHVFIYLGRKSTLLPFLVSPRAPPVPPTPTADFPPLSPPPRQNPARASLVLVLGAGGEDAFPGVGGNQERTKRGSRGCFGAPRPAGLTCVDAALALQSCRISTPHTPLGFFPLNFSSLGVPGGKRLGEAEQSAAVPVRGEWRSRYRSGVPAARAARAGPAAHQPPLK